MDKTLAAIYAVDIIGRRLSPGHRSTSNWQGATAESKSKRVKILNPVFTLGLAITKTIENLLNKVKGSSALNRGGKQVIKKAHFWLNLDRINTIYRILVNINPRILVNLVNSVYFTV